MSKTYVITEGLRDETWRSTARRPYRRAVRIVYWLRKRYGHDYFFAF